MNKTISHNSAGSILLRDDNKSFCLALLKNADGCWVLPKGHVNHGESVKKAAERETKEELGIKSQIKFINDIGETSYYFIKNKKRNFKKVAWFLFKTTNNNIGPLSKENFVEAKWFNYLNALDLLFYPQEKAILIRGVIFKLLSKQLKENLFAIILAGNNSGLEKISNKEWGDIDILITVEILNLKVKQEIAEIINRLENDLKIRIGIDVITKKNLISPSNPLACMKGKIIQSLLELRKNPQRLIYSKNKNIKNFFSPNKNLVKKISLHDIGMSLSRNRRVLCETPLEKSIHLKKIVEKEISASFIITKLAIQYLTGNTPNTKNDTIVIARKIFRDFDFSPLDKNIQNIDNWHKTNNKKKLNEILAETDNYIEEFSAYLMDRINKA